MTNLSEKLKIYKDTCDKSTPVNAWYPMQYEGEVRGPYHRWFRIVGPLTEEIQNGKIVRADASFDVNYAAMAMTEFPKILAIAVRLAEAIDLEFIKRQNEKVTNICGHDDIKMAHALSFDAAHGIIAYIDTINEALSDCQKILEGK